MYRYLVAIRCLQQPRDFICRHFFLTFGLERSRRSLTPHHASHKRQALVSPPIVFSALHVVSSFTPMPAAIFDESFWSAVSKFQRGGSGIKREDEVERIVEFARDFARLFQGFRLSCPRFNKEYSFQ